MSKKLFIATLIGALHLLPGQTLAADASPSAAPPSPANEITKEVTNEAAKETPVEDKVARGLMLWNQDRMIFTPCRDRSYTAVDDASPDGATGKALKTLGLADGVPLYVEVFGEPASGMLRMHGLNMAQKDARCYAPRRSTGDWRAAGGKAWALTVFEGKGTLQQADREDLVGNVNETSTHDRVEIHLQSTSTVIIKLQRQTCHDTAQQRIYAWTAEVDHPGGKLSGCAWRQ